MMYAVTTDNGSGTFRVHSRHQKYADALWMASKLKGSKCWDWVGIRSEKWL